jgi:hypothetical protein
MPLYLKEMDVVPEVAKFQSALIVPCRFCPALSFALRKEQPYIEFFRRFLRTEPYEQHIHNIQSRLESQGVKTSVYRSNLFNFIICMWTERRRQKLLEQACQYEAVVVLGCEGAYENVSNILKPTDCQVFPGMESEGVLSAIPQVHWPFNISLALSSVTPMLCHGEREVRSIQEVGQINPMPQGELPNFRHPS